jgi:hypothetical protein
LPFSVIAPFRQAPPAGRLAGRHHQEAGVIGPNEDHHVRRPQLAAAALRRHIALVAAAVAQTEDEVANTLEQIAMIRPHDATRLRARAEQARKNAVLERARAAQYGAPATDQCGTGQPGPLP